MLDATIEFRKRLARGEVLLGPGVYLTDPLVSEALAESADFLWYDLEHQQMSINALRSHLMVARQTNTPGIVRVPGPGAAILKPVLDAGAHGIVVPQVRSAGEVRQIVRDCRYPPKGERGYWPLIGTNYGRVAVNDYLKGADERCFVAVMIETVEAVQAIDDIVAIDGLDSVVIGFMDLSGSMGILGQIHDPKVTTAAEKVIASARAAGKPVGSGQGVNIDAICDLAERGVQWMQVGADCIYLANFVDQFTSQVRSRLKK